MNIEYLLITKLFKGKIWQLSRYYRILLSNNTKRVDPKRFLEAKSESLSQ